jgi:hypothetical protein
VSVAQGKRLQNRKAATERDPETSGVID